MKKLCYVLPEYDENIGGHFYHHYEFLEELSNLPACLSADMAGKAGKLDVFLIAEKGKGRGIRIQKFRFLPLRFLESFFLILWARIKGYKNFYTHYCYIGGINAGIISRLFGGKSYYWHCEMIWEFKQKILSKIGFNLALKLSHFLVTGSEGLKKEYAKHYGLKLDNIKVMPNWINLRRFKPAKIQITKSKLQTILFVHRLAERKGAHLLVPIVKQLKQNFQFSIFPPKADQPRAGNFQLLVIGDGPLKEKILQEIKENRLEDYVQVLGKVSHKDILKYYAQADVFIMPSLQEGFPHVLLEAMAMGIPYVASDVGAVREMSPQIAQDFIVHLVRCLPSNGVERDNIEKFAEKIKILLLNQEIYNQFREEELEKVKEYSLDKVANKFIELFL